MAREQIHLFKVVVKIGMIDLFGESREFMFARFFSSVFFPFRFVNRTRSSGISNLLIKSPFRQYVLRSLTTGQFTSQVLRM